MFSYADTKLTATRANAARDAARAADQNWVTVTWMPHSSLSQTSHVSLKIRSIHAILEETTGTSISNEWRVEVSICGMGGLVLVPVVSSSTTAPIVSRRDSPQETAVLERKRVYPSIRNATHDCVLDQVLQVPIRWRDLPRDACVLIKIIGQGDSVVSVLCVFHRVIERAFRFIHHSHVSRNIDLRDIDGFIRRIWEASNWLTAS